MRRERVLVTCPPMIGVLPSLEGRLAELAWEVESPELVQTLEESELIELLPDFDGWIIGDDPATEAVFAAATKGRLRAAVKWGVGTDNVDFEAAERHSLPIANTPGMFGREVADIALHYVTGLARETFLVDRGVRAGSWPKPRGISLAGKTVGLVGFGDIGRNIARRLLAAELRVVVYDPYYAEQPDLDVEPATWPDRIEECDILVLACALTRENRHLVDARVLRRVKRGLRLVNVARGALIDTPALVEALDDGRVHSAALEVFEEEPLPDGAALRRFERCVFGSHNASNTNEAVLATSEKAIAHLRGFLAQTPPKAPAPETGV